MLKFFRIPFATSGDKTAVPDAVDVNGFVSYTAGYSFDYQRQKTDPASKNIERDKMNEIFFDITTAIAEIQSQGIADFISTALNGGTPYSYAQNALVRYSGELYVSLVAANVSLPSVAANWALLPIPARLQTALNTRATAGGTADAITAVFTPVIGALPAAPGTLSVLVRAGAANATTTPTLQADSTAAKTIVKGANTALVAGDIAGAGHWLHLNYDPTLDKWVLANPANTLAGAALLASANAFTKGNRGVQTAITPTTGTITLDLAASTNWTLTPTGNFTLANPSSMPLGQCGVITNTQGATPYVISYGSQFKPADGLVLPALTATVGAVDDLVYFVESATRILIGRVGGSV